MRLTRKYDNCDDRTCPAIWDTDDPELVGVQGSDLADPAALADAGSIPSHERIVLVPRSLIKRYSEEEHDGPGSRRPGGVL